MKKILIIIYYIFIFCFMWLPTTRESLCESLVLDNFNYNIVRLPHFEYANDFSSFGDMLEYEILSDPDDTTSWSNSINITSSYESVFGTSSDSDYYDFYVGSTSKTFYVQLSDMIANANAYINIYDNNYNLVCSYSNNTQKDYEHMVQYVSGNDIIIVDNLAYIPAGLTFHIKVIAVNMATPYTLEIIKNPNFSGYSSVLDNGYDKIYTGNKTTIKYKIDPSMNTLIYNTTFTYSSVFVDALSIWNSLGSNIDLQITTDNNYDVLVEAQPSTIMAYYNDNSIGVCLYSIINEGFLFLTKRCYVPTNIYILNDFSGISSYIDAQGISNYPGYASSYIYRQFALQTLVHEIGHSLGINHYDVNRCCNNMFEMATCYTKMGDGDISSLLYNWG
ncbi:hypothetical protein IKQ02_02010 [bacterium]|nr:hypothetical protein [bacterium]